MLTPPIPYLSILLEAFLADLPKSPINQHLKEKGVVVPTIGDTGTGRSIYYSRSEVMEYCLGVGLNFEVAAATVKRLKDEGLVFTSDEKVPKRFMLWWDEKNGKLGLVEFDLQIAIASLDEGKAVIPVWLDVIYQRLTSKLAH
ncbi:MerR family transcriptional regulator [Rivularia sp. UHCC 0363]|uniref:MerR family transcriptional regulator n=1 Tax=Rivularia sp. UHCC 0363 TaxID=3110244 RepID=UPI002B20C5DB|nr:MerR family transcriptional regulator [Rivularia sp. UHCC 0363]MEA5592997.1 MerR family transcriptional regulator [Rivularia sp. UHCC 0363]